MTVDLDKLAELARAATPGPVHAENVVNGSGSRMTGVYKTAMLDTGPSQGTPIAYFPRFSDEMNADAVFFAAANPAAVIELLARVRAAEAALHDISDSVPARGDHGGDCAYCGAIAAMDVIEKHDDDCPWKIKRRAVEATKP